MPDPSSPGSCGIAKSQGADYSQFAPAANLFDRNMNHPLESDYRIHGTCTAIEYYHNHYTNPPPYKTRPADYTTNKLTLFDTPYAYDPIASCPSKILLSPEQLNSLLTNAETEMISLIAAGEESLAIANRYEILSQAVNRLGKIFLKNVTTDPLSPVRYKTATPDFYIINNKLISLYSGILSNSNDLRGISWRYRTIFHYLAVRDMAAADQVLNSISGTYRLFGDNSEEYQAYTDYITFLKTLIDNGSSFFEITKKQKDILTEISQNNKSFVGVYARNILRLYDPNPDHEVVFRP
jgi:hypothetical protein